MRIHLLSDLHFESGRMSADYTPPECDVVLLAGDIATDFGGIDWAAKTFNVPVLYTPGNHEFYKYKRYQPWIAELKAHAAQTPNVTILSDDAIHIDDVRFIGGTLWTDFNLYGNPHREQMAAFREMNDFLRIKVEDGSGLTPGETVEFHCATRDFIVDQLETCRRSVVMTHHAPSEQSALALYRGNSAAYASNLEWIMHRFGPDLWVHGHMHNSVDYRVGATRVVTNPRGYAGHEINPNFNPQLVIEI